MRKVVFLSAVLALLAGSGAGCGDSDGNDGGGGGNNNNGNSECSASHCVVDAGSEEGCVQWAFTGAADQALRASCADGGGTVGSGACPASGSIGGCKTGVATLCQITWYPASQADVEEQVRMACEQGAGTWVEP